VTARAHPTRPQPLLNLLTPQRAENIAQVPLTRSFGCEQSSDPGRTRRLVLVTRSLAMEWPPLGFGSRRWRR
jgi:hypothetical protein